MNDQAANLRHKMMKQSAQNHCKTIAVISGKGGVGKSNFSLNFSLTLSREQKRVLLFDMDIGMGNIDILMGRTAERNIVDYFHHQMSLEEVITEGPDHLRFISGGSGLSHLFSMDNEKVDSFIAEFTVLQAHYDYLVFDLGAGISAETAKFLMCVDEIITITTPEPTSIMDAYSIIKYLHMQNEDLPFNVVCNRASNEREGRETINRLKKTVKQFLGKEIVTLGILPDSKAVSKAVLRQVPFTTHNAHSDISKSMKQLTIGFLERDNIKGAKESQRTFLDKFKLFFTGK
ncbi:MinD/ParA family protein [Bacillus sp. 1P06AnD]|uniref:MinD/ParA family protein n=1 Tax=Bacillus sp. 1P06AnD TaxID=3132208 RepID=UPI0039A31D01